MTWHVLLKALTDLGDYDQVVKLMTDENADGPARTLAQQGTFMWEQWNPGCSNGWPCAPTNNESMSHGWGAWGIVDMIESLAGDRGHEPGRGDGPDRAARGGPGRPAPRQRLARGPSAARSAWPGSASAAPTCSTSTCPTNVTATVAIPNPGGAVNYVGVGAGAPKKVGQQGDRTVFTVGSGSTHFSIGAEVPGGVGGTVPPTLSLHARHRRRASARSRRASRATTRRARPRTSSAPRVTRR